MLILYLITVTCRKGTIFYTGTSSELYWLDVTSNTNAVLTRIPYVTIIAGRAYRTTLHIHIKNTLCVSKYVLRKPIPFRVFFFGRSTEAFPKKVH